MAETMELTGTYTLLTCNHDGCGISFAVPEHVVKGWRKSHQTWYCPNGHSRWFPNESDEEKLRSELAQKQSYIDRVETDLRRARESRDHYERSANTYRGQVTKIKKRVAAGVCPCCKRTFSNLAAHMAGQHPAFVEKTV